MLPAAMGKAIIDLFELDFEVIEPRPFSPFDKH